MFWVPKYVQEQYLRGFTNSRLMPPFTAGCSPLVIHCHSPFRCIQAISCIHVCCLTRQKRFSFKLFPRGDTKIL